MTATADKTFLGDVKSSLIIYGATAWLAGIFVLIRAFNNAEVSDVDLYCVLWVLYGLPVFVILDSIVALWRMITT